MKLHKMAIRNFMPYKGIQNIEFPTSSTQNVMLVFGDNMRGKTSLLNAIRWCFYGVAFGRHLTEIPRHLLFNSESAAAGDWEMEVSISFENEGDKYELIRVATKARGVSKPERPEHIETTVFLKKNESALPGHLIESEINRFAPQQVSRFFLFDGELLQEYETLLVEGSEQGRKIKDAIEQVLGVPALTQGKAEISALLKKAQRDQNQALTHVESIKSQISQQRVLQDKQDSHEKDLADLEGRIRECKKEKEVLDDSIQANNALYEAGAALNQAKERQRVIFSEQEELATKKTTLAAGLWRDILKGSLERKLYHLQQKQEASTKKIQEVGSITNEISNLTQLLERVTCPTCGQDIHGGSEIDFKKRISLLEEKKSALFSEGNDLSDISSKISAIKKIHKSGSLDELKISERQFQRNEIELTKLQDEMEKFDEIVKGNDPSELQKKRIRLSALTKEEGKLEAEIEIVNGKLRAINRELELISRMIRSSPAGKAERSVALVAMYSGLESIFSNSIEVLRDALRARVEKLATDAFLKMTTQESYKNLKINSGYGLTIVDENGDPVSVRSAGAEQIVALSLIDGLGQSGRAAGPVVMDTPFGRLDMKHRDNILRYLPTSARQLVLLVHDGEIRGKDDLEAIAYRIGSHYRIREVSPRHSVIERVTA